MFQFVCPVGSRRRTNTETVFLPRQRLVHRFLVLFAEQDSKVQKLCSSGFFAEGSDEVSFAGQGGTHHLRLAFIISRSLFCVRRPSVEALERSRRSLTLNNAAFQWKILTFSTGHWEEKIPCQRNTVLLVAGSNIVWKDTQNPGVQIKQT